MPLTSRGFADVWGGTTMEDTRLTHQDLNEALEELRRIRIEGAHTPMPLIEHFNFHYGTTKHKGRKDGNKGI